MASFLVRSNLSRGNLKLYLNNSEGYAQDASSVRWTVYDPSGVQVSGASLLATKAAVGEYYAPWFSDVRNGNYTLKWEIKESPSSAPKIIEDKFFIVDPSSYQPILLQEGVPLPGGLTYLSGTYLGTQDLVLYLRNDDGVLTDALAVFWTICDVSGRPITSRSGAPHISLGTYYAPWFANVASGDYSVLWEYQQDVDSPMQSARLGFSIVNPAAPIVTQLYNPSLCLGTYGNDGMTNLIIPSILINCNSPVVSCGVSITISGGGGSGNINCPYLIPVQNGGCCEFEIPRVIHLITDALPPSGGFTDQTAYLIPHGVRHITYYISYKRGTSGGYALFKLYWGNGVEESQETVIDTDISGPTIMGQQGMFLQDLTSPIPIDDTTITFVLYVSVPGGAKTTRLLASEAGVPGIPGTVGITLTASSS